MPQRSESTLSRTAILGGAITALLTAAMGLILSLALRGLLDWTKATTSKVASAAAIAGFILGGFRAGLLKVEAPLTNAAVAAASAGVIVSVGQRLVFGKTINPFGLIVVAVLAASCGVFGGFVSNTAARNRGLK